MNELTHLDLFSGIGGFAIAAQRAGFRTVGFSEVEPYACRVLAERFPQVPNLGDVRKRESFAGLGGITILTGGFPCQPWSEAGKRRGKDDDRHLWPAMCDVIKTVRPSWVIGENVSGFIGMGIDHAMSDLEGIGYSAQPIVIPACAVDARHIRERVWIVAHSDGWRRRADIARGDDPHRPDAGRSETNGMPCPVPNHGGTWDMADPAGVGRKRLSAGRRETRQGATDNDRDASHEQWKQWPSEPAICRVLDGIPARSHTAKTINHRLASLGNAIVPQVVEPFFRWIAQIERGEIA